MKTRLLWPMLYIWTPVTKKMLLQYNFSTVYTKFEINYLSSERISFPTWMTEAQK